jgi:hypothetical protein
MLGIKEDQVSVRGMEMGKDGELKCEVNDLQKKSNRRNKKSIETEGVTRKIELEKKAGRMGAGGNEQRAVQAQGYAEQRGEAGTMEINRRKRVKELTGAEIRHMIVEKNELREVIELEKKAGRMGAGGNEHRAVQAQGYAEQRGEAGTMEINRRKRVKELTGEEIRHMIVEKNELREVKKARKDAKKMVKLGNIKSIDSYFK